MCLSAVGYLGYTIVEFTVAIQNRKKHGISVDNDLAKGLDMEVKVEKIVVDRSRPKEIEFTKMWKKAKYG